MSATAVLLAALGSTALAQDASPSPAASPPAPAAEGIRVSVAMPQVAGLPAQPRAVTSDGTGLVAVGNAWCGPDRPCPGEAWTSSDGLAWFPVAADSGLDLATETGDQLEIVDVAYGPGGYVAVGQPRALWRSVDGRTWERVGLDLALKPTTTLTAITGTAGGYLLVGASRGAKRARAAAWTSPDGATWTQVPDSDALDAGVTVDLGGGVAGSGGMTAVTSDASGFMAAGSVCRTPKKGGDKGSASRSGMGFVEVSGRDTDCRAAVWRSTDGQAWKRELLAEAPRVVVTGTVMGLRGLATLGGKAIVTETGPSAPIVTVVDGTKTKRVDLERKNDLEAIWALGAIGDRFLAVGVPLRGTFGMWTSVDGVTWEPITGVPALPPNANVLMSADTATFAGHFVVVSSAAETLEGGAVVGFSVVGPLGP